MADDWPARFTQEAYAKVDAFIREHPDYTRKNVEQPGQGATNRVIFARSGNDLAVFKVFCNTERKERECFALRHWQETELVPELIWDDDPRMIVTAHIPGISLLAARDVYDDDIWFTACRETGAAVGTLTRVTLTDTDRTVFESRFYEGLGALRSYLERIIELSRSIHCLDRDFQDEFWAESIDFADAQLESILSQPQNLYNQDPGNLNVEQNSFTGFFDLEMCRVGGPAMQLASAIGILTIAPEGWDLFCKGWEEATGSILGMDERRAAAAAAHLLKWREISRYLSYDGTPGSGYDWANPADPVRYQEYIQKVEEILEVKR